MKIELQALAARVRAGSEEERVCDVIASTAAEDSYGEIVEQSWRLERYLANPVVLFAHESDELPIGTAENVRVEDGALRARLRFASAEASPRAEWVWRSLREGTLRGVSVGFVPHGVRFEKRGDRDVMVLSDNELLEISVTPIPANPEALAQLRARAFGGRTQTEKRMKNLLIALGLSAEAEEASAVQVATHLRAVAAATGKESAVEALGVIEALKVKASRADALQAEVDTLRSNAERREREELVARAIDDGKCPAGNEKIPSLIRSLPLESARELVDGLPVVVKRAPETAARKAPEPRSRFASALGVTPEQLAESEKALANRRGTSRVED